jgi:hypothetical protein
MRWMDTSIGSQPVFDTGIYKDTCYEVSFGICSVLRFPVLGLSRALYGLRGYRIISWGYLHAFCSEQ